VQAGKREGAGRCGKVREGRRKGAGRCCSAAFWNARLSAHLMAPICAGMHCQCISRHWN